MSLNLTAAGLADQKAWEAAGYALPSYDREAMITRTKESPCWVHFGAGNIFRAFQANTAQELLNNGTFDRGVIVAEGFDTEIIRDMYQPHDNLSILVILKADGSVEKTVVGSIAESLAADTADSPDFARLKEIFTKDSLQMATFTITEKGYSLKNGAGELLPSVAADFAAGPSSVTSYMGKVASLLYERFLAGEKPVAMVSTDNCSHNGEKLSLALTAYAEPGKSQLPVDHDRQDHPAAGCFHRKDAREGRPRRCTADRHLPPHLRCSVRQCRGMPVPRSRRSFPERTAADGKERMDLYRPGNCQQNRAHEGLHLPEPAAYRTRCVRLPAGL